MGKIKKQYFLSHVNFQTPPPIQGGGIVAYHSLRSGRQTATSDSRDMDRAEAIKFKLMPDGVIRAHDGRYGCGISEWHIITPPHICDTITTAQQHKLLIADERIYNALRHAVL